MIQLKKEFSSKKELHSWLNENYDSIKESLFVNPVFNDIYFLIYYKKDDLNKIDLVGFDKIRNWRAERIWNYRVRYEGKDLSELKKEIEEDYYPSQAEHVFNYYNSLRRNDRIYEFDGNYDNFELPERIILLGILWQKPALDYLLYIHDDEYFKYAEINPPYIEEVYSKLLAKMNTLKTEEQKAEFINSLDIKHKAVLLGGNPEKNYFSSDWLCEDKEVPVYRFDELTEEMAKEVLDFVDMRIQDIKSDELMMKQRAERGWSDVDSYNIYSWFLEVMTPALKHMRANLHSCPVFLQYNGLDSHPIVSDDDESDENFEKWKAILDKMIFLLEEMNEDTCSMTNYYDDETNEAEKEFEAKYGVLGRNFEEITGIKPDNVSPGSRRVYFYSDDPDHPEWEYLRMKSTLVHSAIASYRDKCKDEFFELFKTHFWDLWD